MTLRRADPVGGVVKLKYPDYLDDIEPLRKRGFAGVIVDRYQSAQKQATFYTLIAEPLLLRNEAVDLGHVSVDRVVEVTGVGEWHCFAPFDRRLGTADSLEAAIAKVITEYCRTHPIEGETPIEWEGYVEAGSW